MTWVAVAVGAAGVLGAGASIAGSNRAADAAESAGDQAAQVQREALQTNVALSRPQLEVGTSALGQLASIFGLEQPTPIDFDSVAGGGVGGGGTIRGEMANFPTSGRATEFQVVRAFQEFLGRRPTEEERDYYSDRQRADQLFFDVIRPNLPDEARGETTAQESRAPAPAGVDLQSLVADNPLIEFNREQGEEALARRQSALGLSQSGSGIKDFIDFNQRLSGAGIQDFVLNPLFQLAGFGSQGASQLGSAAQNTGSNLSNIALNTGNARASSFQNAGNIVGNTITDAGQAFALQRILNSNSRAGAQPVPDINPTRTVG